MQSVMQEEMRREMLRTQYEQGRKDAINSALSRYVLYIRSFFSLATLTFLLGLSET